MRLIQSATGQLLGRPFSSHILYQNSDLSLTGRTYSFHPATRFSELHGAALLQVRGKASLAAIEQASVIETQKVLTASTC